MKLFLYLIWLIAAFDVAPQLASTATLLEDLDEVILNDVLRSYSDPDGDMEPSGCTSPGSAAATTFSFDWPGTNSASKWNPDFVGFEKDLFQAVMSHADTAGDRSWSIRISTGGNMYSHFTPDMQGESLPPQNHDEAPWVDEVMQSVSVNLDLNQQGNDYDFPQYCTANPASGGECKPYFVHQAGAYQRDAPDLDVPFFSPSLARHCSGNSCAFASWGTQAHVPTPFTSPIIYINKYTNCGDGIIEFTQMIHNFADPNDPGSTTIINGGGTAVDQTYFNAPWGGPRTSSLPYALEPDAATGILSYADVNDVSYLHLCPWGGNNIFGDPGHDGPGRSSGPTWPGERADLKWLGGYTTFVDGRLLVNQTIEPSLPWCRDESKDCYATEPNQCMVPDCTDAQIQEGTHTRIQLKVAPNSSPNCAYHSHYGDMITVQCNMRDTGFGRTTPTLSGAEPCSPWSDLGFVNTNTGEVLPVAFVRHWSWRPNDRRVYFAVYSTDTQEAINLVNGIFDNTENGVDLLIDVRPSTNNVNVPVDYDPSTLNALTYIYGKGGEFEGVGLEGRSRRRVGSTKKGPGTRDYTVFTINWFGGSRLQAGSTYYSRAFFLSSDLGSVESTAGSLVDSTLAEEIGLERWLPRSIGIYQSGSTFVVLPAASAQGTSTMCGSAAALVCSGTSTPQAGRVPFFYVSCGALTYFGPDPYHLAPSFGSSFPGHGVDYNDVVRSYQCDGLTVRPTWKLMGFFDPNDADCISLATATYDDTVCDGPPTTTQSPTKSPVTGSPSKWPTGRPTHSLSPSGSPTKNPYTQSPMKSPVTEGPSKASLGDSTYSPSQRPSISLSASPTKSPVTQSPTKIPVTASPAPTNVDPTPAPMLDGPTHSPSSRPSMSPSGSPTKSPVTQSPTKSPVTESPSKSPTDDPTHSRFTSRPSMSPFGSPTKSPVTKSPTKIPVTESPSKSPTDGPTHSHFTSRPSMSPSGSPSKPVSQSPMKSPVTESPSKSPTDHPTHSRFTSTPSVSPSGSPSKSLVTQPPTKSPVTKIPSKAPTDGQLPTTSPSCSPVQQPYKCTAFTDNDTRKYSVITKERTTNAAKNVYKRMFVGGKLVNPSQSSVTVNGHVYYGSIAQPINMNFNGGKTKLNTLNSPPLDFEYYEWLATHIAAGSYANGYKVIIETQPKWSCYDMYDFLGSAAQGSNNGKTLVVFTFSHDICLTKTRDGRQFGPSVLAPFSKVTLTNAGYLDGVVIARRFTTVYNGNKGSEQHLHGNSYRGPIYCTPDADPGCMPLEPTTESPTRKPTTMEPTPLACTVCDDRETDWQLQKGFDCTSDTIRMNKKCNKDGRWTENKYCRLSCYKAGNGYPGDVCCDGNPSNRKYLRRH